MTEKRLHLFPDTNLFIQCKDLKDLPWGDLGDFDDIELIVSRPVQKEIDRQKAGGNSRLGRRARKTAGLLREVIANNLVPITIREKRPRVTLALRVDLRADPDLAQALDYNEPDDVLVGTAHNFLRGGVAGQVAVLTDDGGALASAVSTGTPHVAIPETWLLQAEDGKGEKDLKAAQAEIARLRQTEPEIQVKCEDAQGRETGALHLEIPNIKPLRGAEISSLVEYARRRFPMQTDFSSNVPQPRAREGGGLPLEAIKGWHMPPDETQIKKYQDAYQKWEEALATALEFLHTRLRRDHTRLGFTFFARNTGTRPATDVLVEIEANGKFLIRRPYDEDDADDEEAAVEIPSPPLAPKHRRLAIHDLTRQMRQLGMLGASPGLNRTLALMSRSPRPRDPEAFYYKGGSGRVADTGLRLECNLWRHGVAAEKFSGEVELQQMTDTQGSLEFRVHAANLSDTVGINVPIRVRVVEFATYDHACAMIDQLEAKATDS